MRKFSAVLLISMITLSFAACGNTSNKSNSESKSESQTASSGSVSTSNSDITGKTHDTGEFKVLIPDGWMLVEQNDTSGDPDEDGNYPISQDYIGIIKGGESEWDAFSKPTVYIYLEEGDDMASYAESALSWYNEVNELDITIDGKEAIAYETKMEYSSDEDDEEDECYIYNIVYIKLDDSHFAQVSVPIDMVDFKGVSVTDADVMAIMESIELD